MMFRDLLSPAAWPSEKAALALVRILLGGMMAYHGLECFDGAKMAEYAAWDSTKVLPAPVAAVTLGKGIEFFGGICLVLGLFTRLAGLFCAVVMFFITFKIGGGVWWYADQHPFVMGLLSLVFFFAGPKKWSLDERFF